MFDYHHQNTKWCVYRKNGVQAFSTIHELQNLCQGTIKLFWWLVVVAQHLTSTRYLGGGGTQTHTHTRAHTIYGLWHISSQSLKGETNLVVHWSFYHFWLAYNRQITIQVNYAGLWTIYAKLLRAQDCLNSPERYFCLYLRYMLKLNMKELVVLSWNMKRHTSFKYEIFFHNADNASASCIISLFTLCKCRPKILTPII